MTGSISPLRDTGLPTFKIYAESFRDEQHLALIVEEARQIVANALVP